MMTECLAILSAQHLLMAAGNASSNDAVLLIYDSSTKNLIKFFQLAAKRNDLFLTCIKLESQERHGQEPSVEIEKAMENSSLVLALTKHSLAHSKARIKNANRGGRFLSLPQYDLDLLIHKMIRVDYRLLQASVSRLAKIFTNGNHIQLTTEQGTNLQMDISGRTGNACPGYVFASGELGSPPDAEANVAPIEGSIQGVAVIDGSITTPEIGLLNEPVILKIENGSVVEFTTDNTEVARSLDSLFTNKNEKRRVIAEFGVGFNPMALLTGKMLSDEGSIGTAHLGLGSNFTIGGKNKVDFHLDFVFKKPIIFVDKKVVWNQFEFVD
jgi:leucyl aminopeptidase (aminopeptidase T)